MNVRSCTKCGDERRKGTKYCDPCGAESKRLAKREWLRNYHAANRDQINAERRADYPRIKAKRLSQAKERYDPGVQRAKDLDRRYGITVEDYNRMCDEQEGLCAACQHERTLVVDHDHETGVVRGLLCQPCNLALGACEDDLDRLEGLITYLALSQEHGATKGLS